MAPPETVRLLRILAGLVHLADQNMCISTLQEGIGQWIGRLHLLFDVVPDFAAQVQSWLHMLFDVMSIELSQFTAQCCSFLLHAG